MSNNKMQSNQFNLTDLRSLKGLIIDMDGVLWHGDRPLPGLPEFFSSLNQHQIRFMLATNNNTQRPESFVAKAAKFGVEIDTAQIVTASIATVHYLRSRYRPGSRIYVVGEAALKSLITESGFIVADTVVDAVVVTLDRQLTYEMLKRATLLIRDGAEFIVPNLDPSYPTPEGFVPGGGAVVAAVATASDKHPIAIGKPESWMFQICMERMQTQAVETASLGDRLSTDIAGGQRLGLKTILVLSGVTSTTDLEASPIHPTWVFQGLEDLPRALNDMDDMYTTGP